MEIFLLQDVANIGKKNDVLIVGDGFALNYLLPQRLAIVATPLVRRRFAEQIKVRAEDRERERQAQLGAVTALQGKAVRFARKATKANKLYGAITEANIAEELKLQHAITLPEAAILLSEPIKALGTFNIFVEVAGQKAPLTVIVEAEKKEAKVEK